MFDFAVIWDLDGTIANTQKFHSQVESEILLKHGIIVSPEEITEKFSGRKTIEFLTELFNNHGILNPEDLAQKATEKKWLGMKKLIQNSIQTMPGALELIHILSKNKIPMAVASTSNHDYVNFVLQRLQILNLFKFTIGGDQVKKSKPDPTIFLQAAKALNFSPEKIIVIEDGRVGIEAAQKAEMKCIAVRPYFPQRFHPTIYVKSLEQISFKTIKELF